MRDAVGDRGDFPEGKNEAVGQRIRLDPDWEKGRDFKRGVRGVNGVGEADCARRGGVYGGGCFPGCKPIARLCISPRWPG